MRMVTGRRHAVHRAPQKQRARFTWNFRRDNFASTGRVDAEALRTVLEQLLRMIGLAAGTRIWIVAGVTDMRRGFVGLSGMVQTALEQNPFSGHVFVFRGQRGDLVKLLWWDGDGLCLFAKRLERGRFIWPQADERHGFAEPAQLSMLLEGIDWRRPVRSYAPQMAV